MSLGKNGEQEKLNNLKINLREEQIPFFEDSELLHHLRCAAGDVELASYNCLIIKAEECSLNVSGLSLADSSAYWLRLAAMYRPNCTTMAKGG